MEQAIEPPPSRRHTVAEYFELEYASEQKHEYRDGEVTAMAGGTESHSLISANLIRSLGNRLDQTPCRVYDSSLRVSPAIKKKYYYPDVLVVCGERQFDPNDRRKLTITNPELIFEVLSDATEDFDRDEEFLSYIRSESLKEYVLIAQHTPRVQTYFRRPDGTWSFDFAEGKEATARLRSLQINLPLSEVYAKVEMAKLNI